ncbi:MAG: hypothetical protein IKS17_00025 [Firmicutes bacterium]|nr:hypothetical protein [Bacillota bacterium]
MEKLFRKEAVDNYKDRFAINRIVPRVPFRIWAICILFVVGIMFSAVWLVFGRVTTTVNVDGVVFPPDGFEEVSAWESGVISDISVDVGDEVEAGDIVAVVSDSYRIEEIERVKKEGKDAETVDNLQRHYLDDFVIRSKFDGLVVSRAAKGSFLLSGDSVAKIAVHKANGNAKRVIAFLPTSNRYIVQTGCEVQISPDYAPREKYGYISGYVSYVGTDTVTKKTLDSKYDEYNVSELLQDGKTYFAVYIDFALDDKNEGELVWSLEESRSIPVELGSNCRATIVVYKETPLEWLLGGYKR